ncbi:MAG: hypothetical protein ACK4Z0_02475 [Sphingomonadaceae bacterium]
MLGDLSFREKSAWAMAGLFLLITLAYLVDAQPLGWRSGVAPPVDRHLVKVAVAAIAGSIIVQAILAARHPREAERPADEREQQFALRASHWSGYVLAAGAIASLVNYLVHGSGDLLFHGILLSLLVATLAENLGQIWLYRRSG